MIYPLISHFELGLFIHSNPNEQVLKWVYFLNQLCLCFKFNFHNYQFITKSFSFSHHSFNLSKVVCIHDILKLVSQGLAQSFHQIVLKIKGNLSGKPLIFLPLRKLSTSGYYPTNSKYKITAKAKYQLFHYTSLFF